MWEVLMGIMLCVVMGGIATADNRSGIIWGFLTALLCAVSLLIPLPFLRFLIAGLACFSLMILAKLPMPRLSRNSRGWAKKGRKRHRRVDTANEARRPALPVDATSHSSGG